jgi:hypothetical protein
MYLGLKDPDPDPLVRCIDPDPDPSIIAVSGSSSQRHGSAILVLFLLYRNWSVERRKRSYGSIGMPVTSVPIALLYRGIFLYIPVLLRY